MQVYDLPALGRRFDVVLFLGVLYHLRHPQLALGLVEPDRDESPERAAQRESELRAVLESAWSEPSSSHRK